MKLIVLLFMLTIFLTPVSAQAPYLIGGGITFASPVRGAFEFVLVGGMYQPQQLTNGFYFGNGSFHLAWKSYPGNCFGGCTFYGQTGQVVAVKLDANCQQISFSITHGRLIANTLVYKNVSALYSQTFCQTGGSLFMAGGSLVIYGAGL